MPVILELRVSAIRPLKNTLSPPGCPNGNDFHTERKQAREPRTSFLKMNHGAWLEPGLGLLSVHSELVKPALDSLEFWKIHQRGLEEGSERLFLPLQPGAALPFLPRL